MPLWRFADLLKNRITRDIRERDRTDQTISIIRHEFGNSVNALKITMHMLHQNFKVFDENKCFEYIKRALTQIAAQHRFLDAMQVYLRTDVQGAIAGMPFSPFWKDWVEASQQKLVQKGFILRHHSDTDRLSVLGNRQALWGLLDAVLNNAVEALVENGDPVVVVDAHGVEDLVKISVRDRGCGIDSDDLEKAFLPFYSTKKNHAGIGLSVAQKILGIMEGRIELASTRRKGTTTTIWLKKIDHPD